MNPANLSKAELVARARFRCKHRHSGLDHTTCYERDHPSERVGFFDIESTNLNASFGYCLSFCIKKQGGEILKRCVKPQEIRAKNYDKRLCEQFVADCYNFDRLIGWYSSRFDVPFMRTRCLYWGIDFPPFGSMFHTDAWFSCRSKLRLHSNRLEAACTFFDIPSKCHRLTPQVWQAAAAGDKKSLDFILTHNVEDVESTEAIWNKLSSYTRLNKTSV